MTVGDRCPDGLSAPVDCAALRVETRIGLLHHRQIVRRRKHLHVVPHRRDTYIRMVADRFALLPHLRRDDDYAVGALRTVNCRRCGVLEHFDLLDVVGIDRRQRVLNGLIVALVVLKRRGGIPCGGIEDYAVQNEKRFGRSPEAFQAPDQGAESCAGRTVGRTDADSCGACSGEELLDACRRRSQRTGGERRVGYGVPGAPVA